VRIGFALFAQPYLGADALWWSFPLGSSVTLALAYFYYRYGGWRRGVLAVPPDPAETGEQAHATTEPAGRQHPTG
jgi:hypothetical protein